EAGVNGDERLRHRGMELRADVALDLHESFVLAQAGAVWLVRDHRVEAVRNDQEVRGERELLRGDSVVAAPVEALVVQLDGARLGSRELETAQQASREARGAPHRSPR